VIRPGERCGFPVLDEGGAVRACGEPATCERLVDAVPFPACDACAALRDMRDASGGWRDPLDPIDWHNATAVTWWLGELFAIWADADAVTRDMLRPARQRTLGHREHRRLYREAAGKLAELLARAVPLLSEKDEHGDPAGMGGAVAE
jgi:hypothetical protein